MRTVKTPWKVLAPAVVLLGVVTSLGGVLSGCDSQDPGAEAPTGGEGLSIRLPDRSGEVGDTVQVPIQTDSLAGRGVSSYQFSLPYDQSVVRVTGVAEEGTLTPSAPVVNNSPGEGTLSVSFAGVEPLGGDGNSLLNLEMELVGSGTAALSFQSFQLFDENAEEIETALEEGTITAE